MITLGQQSQLGIGIAIKLQDQFSGAASKVLQSMRAMKAQQNSNVVGAMKDYRNYALGIAATSAVATKAMFSMAEAGAEFQHTINKIAIIGGKELGLTRTQLMDFAHDMSKIYTQSPLEVANAAYENVKAGITTGLKEITNYQMATATAVGERLDGPGGVAEKLLGIMNAMDIPQSKFGDIANSITAVANATISNVSDIGEAMQYAAFTAKTFNVPLETTLALVGKLSQAKIIGSSAGTGISNMFLQLAKSLGPFATKKSQKAWGMLGIDMNKMAKLANSGNINDVILSLSRATEKMSPIMRNDILSTLFNRRGDRAIEGLFDSKNGNVSIASLVAAAQKGEKNNTVMSQAKKMMNDLTGDFAHFRNSLMAFKDAFAVSVGPFLRVLIHGGTALIGVFTAISKTGIGKVLLGVAVVTIPLIGVLFAFRAAALTAAIALNGFSSVAGAGTFKGLMGAGLDMASAGHLGARGVRTNINGRAIVSAGQSINYGGKIYKGGQFLPNGFNGNGGWGAKVGNFVGMGSMLSGTSWAAKLAGFAGKGLPMLGKLVSFGFKWLPVVGWILTITDILDSIFGIFSKKERDPVRDYYNNQLHNESLKKYFPERQLAVPFEAWQAIHGGHDKLLQTINIVTPDGKKILSKTMEQKMEQDMNNQFNFNTVH